MKVLVTGGAGLIGLAIRRLLATLGHEVVATDLTDYGRSDPELVKADLRDAHAMDDLVASSGIEAIVHSGGISGPVMIRDQPLAIIDINVTATARLLEAARRHRLKRFILLSSHVVYGDVGPGVITEEFPAHPSTTYAATKVAGEALVESFSREWGVSALSLRVTRVYGPYRRDNCFLRQIIRNTTARTPTTIPCDLEFAYHYIHVDDVVGAIAAALGAAQPRFHAYNVTSGEVLTMPQVVAAVRRALPEAEVRLLPGADDAPEVQADFSLDRIRADLGWEPGLTLAQGFAAYLASVRADGIERTT